MTTADTIHLAAAAIRDCGTGEPHELIHAAWLDSVAGRLDRGIDWDYAAAYAHALFAEETA